jgi:hypothetical protein
MAMFLEGWSHLFNKRCGKRMKGHLCWMKIYLFFAEKALVLDEEPHDPAGGGHAQTSRYLPIIETFKNTSLDVDE